MKNSNISKGKSLHHQEKIKIFKKFLIIISLLKCGGKTQKELTDLTRFNPKVLDNYMRLLKKFFIIVTRTIHTNTKTNSKILLTLTKNWRIKLKIIFNKINFKLLTFLDIFICFIIYIFPQLTKIKSKIESGRNG